MKNTIFIPKIINVGYQERNGTYTGKLAYVVYTDEKGVLRKEASWNSWRDHKINPDSFDNIPTSGFVLNKKVGDYKSGWDFRQAYCRIYDPRGFEFEITIENLLYILENVNSIKGKGLEGEFVYGWDGKELVLLPVDSPDYKSISEYTKIVQENLSIKAKDLVIGGTYLTKDNKSWIYLGKFDLYDKNHWSINSCTGESFGKYFWFINAEDNSLLPIKSIPANKFINCLSDQCCDNYAELYSIAEKSYHFSACDKSKDKLVDISLEEVYKIIHRNYWGEFRDTSWNDFNFISNGVNYKADHNYKAPNLNSYILYKRTSNYIMQEVLDVFPTEQYETTVYFKRTESRMIPVTIEEIFEKMHPQALERYSENNILLGRIYENDDYYNIK